MKALLRTEYMLSGGYITFCCALGCGILMPFLPGFFLLMYSSMLSVLLMILPQIISQMRMKSGLHRYSLVLPYSRRQTVHARYLFYLTLAAVVILWALLLYGLHALLHPNIEPVPQDTAILFLRIALLPIGLAVVLPLTLAAERFDKKALLAINYVLFYFGIMWYFGGILLTSLLNTDLKLTAANFGLGVLAVLLILAVSFGISLAAYCGGFRRKGADA